MISLRNHGGNLAGNGFVLVKAHIPLSFKSSAQDMYRYLCIYIYLTYIYSPCGHQRANGLSLSAAVMLAMSYYLPL